MCDTHAATNVMPARIDPKLWVLLEPYFGAPPQEDLGSDPLGKLLTEVRVVSSLPAVGAWLCARGLPHTATGWTHLKDDRIQAALDEHKLEHDELPQLLADLEEHGQQHVLLYKVKPEHTVDWLLNRDRVQSGLTRKKLAHALDNWTEITAPVNSKIVSVRFEDESALLVKTVETRDSYKVVNNLEIPGGKELQFKRRIRARRVRVARLHPDGLLEVRLGSIATTRNDHSYINEADDFLNSINWLIPPTHFEPVSLKAFKSYMWRKNRRSRDRIGVISSALASDEGNGASFTAKNRKTDASKDEAVQESNAAFMKVKGSALRKAEICWYAQKDDALPRLAVVVRLTGEINEFCTTRAGTREDYEHVFNDIRRFGRL